MKKKVFFLLWLVINPFVGSWKVKRVSFHVFLKKGCKSCFFPTSLALARTEDGRVKILLVSYMSLQVYKKV